MTNKIETIMDDAIVDKHVRGMKGEALGIFLSLFTFGVIPVLLAMPRYQSVVLDNGYIARVGTTNSGVTGVYCDNSFKNENPHGGNWGTTYAVVDLDGDSLPDERTQSFTFQSKVVTPEDEAIFIEAVEKLKGGEE